MVMMINKNEFDLTPLYNLSSVLRETGLKADLVRAWENRYGLPKPQRSAGGHRLYSMHDIQILKWLRSRQSEGMSISSAVDLWNNLLAKGEDPLVGIVQRQNERIIDAPDTGLENLRDEWLGACMRFDGFGADAVLNQSFSLYPVEQVCSGILQEGLRIMGERWYAGTATVHQEHFASAIANRKLDTLLSSSPIPTRDQTILLGCPAEEWHTFPALLLSVLFARRGYKVVYLGANLPPEHLAETADVIKPDLVILTAQRLATAATLRTAALQLHRYQVSFGGLIFNRNTELRHAINGHFLGKEINQAIHQAELLLSAPQKNPSTEIINAEFLSCLASFNEKRGLIETELNKVINPGNFPNESLREATGQFGNAIAAALAFGNLDLIHQDLSWVTKLLKNRKSDQISLAGYLNIYSQAVTSIMGQQAKPIVDWLDRYTQSFDSMNMEQR
jgi:MerR family transcriptional regulator, light-induced transcriptional regulator